MAKFGFQPIHFSALGIDKNKALRAHRFKLANDVLHRQGTQFERLGKDDHPKGLMLTKHSQLVCCEFFRTATDDDWFHFGCLPNCSDQLFGSNAMGAAKAYEPEKLGTLVS